MRRLVRHAAVGVACATVAVSAAVAGLGSPAVSGTALAVPAPQVALQPTPAVAAERASREAAVTRSAERERLASAAVEHASLRSSALTSQGEAIRAQQAEIVAARKAAAAAERKRVAAAKAKARARAVEAAATAERERKAAAKAKAARVKAQGFEAGTTDPKEMARQILQNRFGYGADQFSCFNNIIIRESGWDVDATNASSGAYGIPQALPGSKMASVASDWRTNPATQIIWGVQYMKSRYGSPCSAWGFKSSHGWY